MDNLSLSRRSLLQAIATALATAAVPVSWTEVAQALDHYHGAPQVGGEATIALLSAAEAADIDAVASQIVPTDDSPGAREAGVIYFIDRALATFFSHIAGDYRAQLAAFQAGYRERHPSAASFASLTSDEQIEYLTLIDQTPFFTTTHLFTLLGMFSQPAYGGNRDGVGWKLIGFEDRHAFYPPFGHYDRDYPGFASDAVKTK
ncbi:MAG TPA: gluconate 2-dehydrogenase subunit 3 family protein [Vicinamibacterales bacterium]|jgi:gluconate 2-dehydrogenase gamma chain